MKTFIALLLASCVVSLAQMNTNNSDLTSGKVAPFEATGRLMNAVQYGGNVEAVKLLLEDGADVNAKDNNGWTPLFHAAKFGNVEIVKLLLERGADVNAKSKTAGTPLKFAAMAGQTNVVGFLFDKGADINATSVFGETVLMAAVYEDKIDVVKLLLAKGAKVNAEDDMGNSALDNARRNGNAAIVQLLQKAGATKSSATKQAEDLSNNLQAMTNSLQKLQQSAAALSNSWPSFQMAGAIPSSPAVKAVNSVVASGTNTDSSGYVTNAALLTPFTMTNSFGVIITNAVLVKLTPNKFIYKTPDGGWAMTRLESLSEDLQERFGYDPSKAAQADAADAEKKTQQDQMWQRLKTQAAANARYQAIKAEVEQGNRRIEGKVLQKIPEGLLVESGAAAIAIGESMHNVSWAGGTIREGTTPGIEALGLVLLQDYPDPNMADEGHVDIIAYPVGLFTYDSVNKSSKTVRKFSCDLEKAIRTTALEEN